MLDHSSSFSFSFAQPSASLVWPRKRTYDAAVQLNRRNWIAALTCFAVLLLILFSVSSSDDLLARSTRLALTQDVITNELTYSGYHFFYHRVPSYAWLSDARLLFIHEVRRGMYGTVRMDLAAKSIVKHEGLGLTGQSQGMLDGIFYWRVSPDGQWILTVSKARDDLIYTANTLDNGRQVAWTNRSEGGMEPIWLSDSSGFIEWLTRDGINCARVRWLSSGMMKEFDLGSLPATPLQNADRLKLPHAAVSPKILSFDSTAELFELSGSGEGSSLRRHRLSIPDELHRGEGKVVVSPRGDRLAWLFHFEQKVPQLVFSKFFPFVDTRSRYSTALLVSRLDGTAPITVGHLQPGEEIGNIQWTPDGQRLSFVYRGALWTVPVN